MHVNYIHHLSCFFFRSERNSGMRPTHVSLYMALFRQWNNLKFCVTMAVNRLHVMSISKIGSKDCYHRCMKDLHDWGFLEYHPDEKPRNQAKVTMKPLTLLTDQHSMPVKYDEQEDLLTETGETIRQVTGQKPGRIYKTKQTTNEKQKKTPSLEEVSAFFTSSGHSETHAVKFFTYYESIGWLQGGRTPIVNWKASADKWMLNKHAAKKKSHYEPGESDKPQDYGTPL